MARPISWLPQLHRIRRSVAQSSRSHYGRHDLEQLFEVQPRSAQKLLELFPATRVGTSRLVEREALATFLDRVHDAEDPGAVIEAQRQAGLTGDRRKLHHFIRTDRVTATLAAPPPNLAMAPGSLHIRFETLEELAQTMFSVAQMLEHEGGEMAARYELRRAQPDSPEAEEVQRMFRELEATERR